MSEHTNIEERVERDLERMEATAQQKRHNKNVKEPWETGNYLKMARVVKQQLDGLVRWRDEYWLWRFGGYSRISEESIRRHIYMAMDNANKAPTKSKVSNLEDALRAEAFLSNDLEPPLWLDTKEAAESDLVPVKNGILNIKNRTLDKPTSKLFALSSLPVEYDPNADCPEWLKFMGGLWPEDDRNARTLKEIFGYIVSGETSLQKIFFLVGPPRAGKGTVLRVLSALLGRSNVAAPTFGALSTQFGLASLVGKSAALMSDVRVASRADAQATAEHLLSISGEDAVNIDRKFLPTIATQLGTRFVIASNELPRIPDPSGALASRLTGVTFTQSWLGREDYGLTDRLLHELPGILNWALDGLESLTHRGRFAQSADAEATIQEIHNLGAPIREFIDDVCVVEPCAEISTREIYQRWRQWCAGAGRDHPGTQASFGKDLHACEPSITKERKRENGKRVPVYVGIRLDTPGNFASSSVSTAGQNFSDSPMDSATDRTRSSLKKTHDGHGLSIEGHGKKNRPMDKKTNVKQTNNSSVHGVHSKL